MWLLLMLWNSLIMERSDGKIEDLDDGKTEDLDDGKTEDLYDRKIEDLDDGEWLAIEELVCFGVLNM